MRERPQPLLFVGHGSPMNAVEENRFVADWRMLGQSLATPQAILVVSAHWQTVGAQVTANPQPRTIHDFYNFPDELYRMRYPAPGAPQIAARIVELTGGDVQSSLDWGLDHGAWAVLCRIWPQAQIPTLQLSLDRNRTPREHLELARALAPLRDEGVLILGSGNLVHNLALLRWDDPAPYPWAVDFDSAATAAILRHDLSSLSAPERLGPAAHLAVPTDEHYLPLLYVLALRRPDEPLDFFSEGIVYGSISMRGVRIG